jgi:hypothetical protein
MYEFAAPFIDRLTVFTMDVLQVFFKILYCYLNCGNGTAPCTNYCVCTCRCIDGYSRRIMWLKCSYSNHLPNLIAGYYLECVRDVGGYPSKMRTDCGTENVTVAAIQSLVMGSESAHVYGTSPGNQRIEAWWSFFRRQHSQYWIDLFETLVECGAFHPGNSRETDCLRFSFMDVVQRELDFVRQQWNIHRIRPSAGSRCPAGVPDELFFLPQAGAIDKLVVGCRPLPIELLQQIEEPRACQDTVFMAFLNHLCVYYNWDAPADVDSALKLYFKLLPFCA